MAKGRQKWVESGQTDQIFRKVVKDRPPKMVKSFQKVVNTCQKVTKTCEEVGAIEAPRRMKKWKKL